jgi:hypothetical protein
MSLRIPSLLLVTLGAFCAVLAQEAPSTQAATEPVTEPAWEYRVLTLEPNRCVSGEAMMTVLNTNGRQGWELVGFQAGPPQLPTVLEGSVAMRAGAPQGRNDLYPQLADTIEGIVNLNVPQVLPGACQLIFKRKAATLQHR